MTYIQGAQPMITKRYDMINKLNERIYFQTMTSTIVEEVRSPAQFLKNWWCVKNEICYLQKYTFYFECVNVYAISCGYDAVTHAYIRFPTKTNIKSFGRQTINQTNTYIETRANWIHAWLITQMTFAPTPVHTIVAHGYLMTF